MEEKVTFKSGDLNISGVVHRPDDMIDGERRPAVLVLHGFGSRKDAENVTGPSNMFMNYILVGVDLGSRRLYLRYLNKKSAKDVLAKVLEIIEESDAFQKRIRDAVKSDDIELLGTKNEALKAHFLTIGEE